MVAYFAKQVVDTTREEWRPSDSVAKPALELRAEELWPDRLPFAEANRRRWMQAVQKVRATYGGWVLDKGSSPRSYY